ncbi:hypothetical protein AX15_006509 [Amanita polypyramis BW_CC]|nr:hypothetical protein AX15_006509 [Amanita polypyramis BW_CC]
MCSLIFTFKFNPRNLTSKGLRAKRPPLLRKSLIAFRTGPIFASRTSPMASEIIAGLPQKYEAAVKSGDLLFFPSTIEKHTEYDVDFEIRVCPALQRKPKTQDESLTDAPVQSNTEKKFDPFAPPYNPNLHIGDIHNEETEDEYVVLFNKYSVVPQHFILASKEYQSQHSPLTPGDLVTIFRLLLAARRIGRNFFAFYNCGINSGASQPHKHIQFLPLDDTAPPIEKLARRTNLETIEKPFTLTRLPYANHVRRFPSDISFYENDRLEATLSQAFVQLLDLVISTIRHDPDYPAGKLSYNVWITPEHLHLIPRRHETYTTGQRGDISVNSLGFAGMLLVKSDEQLVAVRNESIGKILRGVGLESIHEEQVQGTAAEAIDEVFIPPRGSVL